MNFDKVIILLLMVSNLVALHVNHKLFDLVTDLEDLVHRMYAINDSLMVLVKRGWRCDGK